MAGKPVLISIASEFDTKGIKEAQKQLANLEKNIPTNKFQQFGQNLQVLSGRMTKLGGGLTKNLTLPIVGVGAALVAFAKGAEDAEVANRRLDAVLTEMGFADATARVSAYAEELERTIAVDADVIKATQTKLATFKELTATVGESGGTFDRATMAALNLAAAGFGSAETNAVQLGKALNDPIKGITALGRAGVTFTAQEKEKIKALVESGNLLEAQNLVLTAIEGQLGDTAAASASSFTRMKLSLMQIADAIGLAVLPLINSLADVIANDVVPKVVPMIEKIVAAFSAMSPTMKSVLLGVIALAAGIGPLILVIAKIIGLVGSIIVGLGSMGAALTFLTGPIGLTIAAVAALTAAIVFLYRNNEDFRNFVRQVWSQISTFIGTAIGMIRKFIDDNRASLEQLRAGFMQLATFLSVHLGPIIGFLIQNYLQYLIAVLKGVIFVVTQVIQVLVSIMNTFRQVSNAIGQLIRDFQTGFSMAFTIVRNFRDGITGAFSNAGNLLYNIGRDIVMGLWRGLQSMTGFITTEIGRWVNRVIPDPIRRILRISSPSRVFEDIGTDLVDGLVLGLDDNAQRAIDAASEIARGIESQSSVSFTQTGLELARSMGQALLDEIMGGGRVFSALMDGMDALAESLNRTSYVTIVTRRVEEGGGGAPPPPQVSTPAPPGRIVIGAGISVPRPPRQVYDPVSGVFRTALAEGGIVTRPTNALIGEAGPEAVIPLNRANGMMGNIYNITVNPGLSTNADTGRAVVEAIKHYERISGKQFANA